MPAQSESQRRLIYARFGTAWAKRHHFDNPGKLPAHKKPRSDAITQALSRRNR